MLGNLSCFSFFKLTFSKNSFRNTIRVRVSNSLDPDQDQGYQQAPVVATGKERVKNEVYESINAIGSVQIKCH